MGDQYTINSRVPDFGLWDRMSEKRMPVSFDLEITARCNNSCRHCYINLPAGDRKAQKMEMPLTEIEKLADQAVSMGTIWCLITGGEPLLRNDFTDIYLMLKKKGLLVVVFTNACLINEKHIELFKKYPPRDIEVTVYGVTKDTYEKVTGKTGSFAAFMRGLNMLLCSGIKVRLKAVAIKSNVHELPEIAKFCRERTCDYFRFDPLIHLRFDGNEDRNKEIREERLSPEEIVIIEQRDKERSAQLEKNCDALIKTPNDCHNCNHLFHCGAGNGSFNISYDGYFRLCSSLWHPDCIYDLRKGTIEDAWKNFVPHVRDMRSNDPIFLEKCRSCPIINLCLWCPAHAYLETGEMDSLVEYFCKVAHERAKALGYEQSKVFPDQEKLTTS